MSYRWAARPLDDPASQYTPLLSYLLKEGQDTPPSVPSTGNPQPSQPTLPGAHGFLSFCQGKNYLPSFPTYPTSLSLATT